MEINLIWDTSVCQAPAGFKQAIEAAAEVYQQFFSGNYTVNITVGWGTYDNVVAPCLTDTSQGEGADNGVYLPYSEIEQYLTVGQLPTGISPSQLILVSYAEEKQWGLIPASGTEIDGSIGFGTNTPSAYWEMVALAEISHALGRTTEFYVYDPTAPCVLDLFRYDAPGELNWTGGEASYFSTDGGQTQVIPFSTIFDYTAIMGYPNDPYDWLVSGATQTLTNFDILMMEAMGFNSSQPAMTFQQFNGVLEAVLQRPAGTTDFVNYYESNQTETQLISGLVTSTEALNNVLSVVQIIALTQGQLPAAEQIAGWTQFVENGGSLLQQAAAFVASDMFGKYFNNGVDVDPNSPITATEMQDIYLHAFGSVNPTSVNAWVNSGLPVAQVFELFALGDQYTAAQNSNIEGALTAAADSVIGIIPATHTVEHVWVA